MAVKETDSTKNNKPQTAGKTKPTAATRPAPASNKPTAATRPAPAAIKPTAATRPAPASNKPTAATRPAPAANKPTAAIRPAPASNKPTAATRPAPAATKPTAATRPAPAANKPTAAGAKIGVASKTGTTSAPSAKKTAVAASKTTAKTTEKQGIMTTVKAKATAVKTKTAAIVHHPKFKFYAMGGAVVLLALIILLSVIFGMRACSAAAANRAVYSNQYKQTSLVGVSYENLGKTSRHKPVAGVHDGGLATGYPKYGYTLNLTTEQKNAILAENRSLCGKRTTNTGGVYDWMDKDGYLYAGTRENGTQLFNADGSPRQLYRHSASVGLYFGDVSDSEPAVIKKFKFRPRSYTSYYDITGLYAPAGEVIEIRMSGADMNATGGIVVHIGQALYNGQSNNIWNARNFNRMPVILNTLHVTKDTSVYDASTDTWTCYVGSFFGGPIYIRDERVTFSVTVSGGVNYAHFILGKTTPEEYAEYSKSSAPFFDLEVWDSGVLHSGPFIYAKNFSYDELYKAAILWEKVSFVSTSNWNQGIVFIYDPFVAAGAAVAFPGRRSVNCPADWMTSSLNYNSTVTSGSWGNFHEYNHNFQNYGVGYTGEVTNNGLTLVSYSLFTKISAARQLASYGGAGLSGWNCYTSATWALQRVNMGGGAINSTNGLAVYATLLHNFGQNVFLQARGYSNANYLNRFADLTHQDMSYFASKITGYTGSLLATAETDYPMFVPVASVYQTGRSYSYDGEKRYFDTQQPFVIPYGKPYTVDLNAYEEYTDNNGNFNGQYKAGSLVVGTGFKASIKSVKSSGISGRFTETKEKGIYTFTPGSELRSGKIYVTLEITTESGEHTYNGHTLDDVDLVLEFQQSYEYDKTILERTTYYYSAGDKYSDAREAFEKSYEGYQSKSDRDHSNPTQNCNTDIWYYPNTAAMHTAHPDAPDNFFVDANSIDEVRGKLYIVENGKYRIYLRGRQNCALYYSLDGGTTYTLGTYIADNSTSSGWRADKFFDLELKAESWVYFKEVLVNAHINNGMAGFIGMGIAQWTVPMYTTRTVYYDSNGNVVPEDSENIATSETHYYNSSNQEVSAEEAANVEPVPPTSISYATAYRSNYELEKEFTSDIFNRRTYNYNYDDTNYYSGTPSLVSVSHEPWDNTRVIDYLLDGKTNTSYHSASGSANYISPDKPFELIVDLGNEFTANHVTFYGYHQNNPINNLGMPISFTLYGSLDGKEFFELFGRDNMSYETKNITFDFDPVKLRYYKLHVTLTDNQKYFAMSEIKFYYHTTTLTGNGNNFFSPDNDMFSYKGRWSMEYPNSSFGHIYVGKKCAQMSFTFEGTKLALLSSKYYGKKFEVYIDKKKVGSVTVKADGEDYAVSYLSPDLKKGKHSVIIKCVGEANFDSIVFY